MSEQPSANAGEERTDHECPYFEFRGIDAHCFGRNFIVANGEEATAIGGVNQVLDAKDGDRGDDENPDERGKRQHTESARATNVIDTVDFEIEILNDDTNDLIEAERDNGEIIPPQSQTRDANA